MKIFCNTLILVVFSLFGAAESCEKIRRTTRELDPYYWYPSDYKGRRAKTDWCSLSCGPDKNVGCTNNGKCDPKAPCILDALDKQNIVQAHNKLRNKFASGSETNAGGIQASNMLALKWDDDLAFTASCNLKECAGMTHDKCHTTPKFPVSAGQNLWTWSTSTNKADCPSKALTGVQSWYDEVSLTDANQIKSDAKAYQYNSGTGHFTQVIWATTSHVGCALTKKSTDSGVTCTMACNYGPAGNVMSGSMFKEGKPCSECPGDIPCNSKLSGLCGSGIDLRSGTQSNTLPKFSLIIAFVFWLTINSVY